MDLLEKSSSHGWRRGAHVRRKKMVEQPETELSKLQIRIIHLLGLLNNKTCLSFLDTDPLKHHSGWCDTSAIKLCLPFGDMKPTVYIGKSFSYNECLTAFLNNLMFSVIINRKN